jgi:hypothetical protein
VTNLRHGASEEYRAAAVVVAFSSELAVVGGLAAAKAGDSSAFPP